MHVLPLPAVLVLSGVKGRGAKDSIQKDKEAECRDAPASCNPGFKHICSQFLWDVILHIKSTKYEYAAVKLFNETRRMFNFKGIIR